MKKLLLVLGMITCMFGMTACGATVEEVDNYGITEEQAFEYAEGLIVTMDEVVAAGQVEQYKSDTVVYAALENYEKALPDMGDYQSVTDHEIIYDDGILMNITVQGSLRPANVEIMLDEELVLISISTNVEYTFGEVMTKAALNTLMGMGTVFTVLILIIVLISSFSLIPKIQDAFSGKKEEKKDTTTKVVEQIIQNKEAAHSEDLTDDAELVAVIAA
ncbi:MAG: OadG family protein, partial [Lachnospiraceae bacterium]|nr:OadG family protein [Lachnospiraceae bacterium]